MFYVDDLGIIFPYSPLTTSKPLVFDSKMRAGGRGCIGPACDASFFGLIAPLT